jgi:putative lipoic acid-binding regulatory protein
MSEPPRSGTLQTFPGEVPIKVMGRSDSGLEALTRAIVEARTGALDDARIRTRTSTDGNFLAITYLIEAQSQVQLDDIYRALTACTAVLMAL